MASAPPDTTALHLLAEIVSRQKSVADIQPGQWRRLTMLAKNHKVFPLFHDALLASPNTTPKPILRQISLLGLREKARAARIEDTIVEVSAILDDAGIPALWLKGVALGYTVYPAFWLRSMVDIDVIVPYDQRRHARDAMQAAGYTYNATRGGHLLDDEILDYSTHHYVFLGHENRGVTIELHFHFLNMVTLTPAITDWFWQTSDTVTGPQGTVLRVMNPEAILLHLAAHNVLQHQQFDIASDNAVHVRLRNMYDVSRLVTQHALDWPTLITQAITLKWEFALGHTLLQAGMYFPFPQTSGVYEAITALRERTSIPSPAQLRSPDTVRRSFLMWRILRQLPWRYKSGYLWRMFFPTRDAMRHTHPDQPLWWAYIARSIKILRGVSHALYLMAIGKKIP